MARSSIAFVIDCNFMTYAMISSPHRTPQKVIFEDVTVSQQWLFQYSHSKMHVICVTERTPSTFYC